MISYPKIETLFVRNDKTHKLIIPLKLRQPVYGTIKSWIVTEKIDGTNIRVESRPDGTVTMNGRSDNAQLPADFVRYIYETFTNERLDLVRTDPEPTIVLFGEGYGAGIQKGGGYRQDKSFILFDVAVVLDDKVWWQSDDVVTDFANKLRIDRVPIIGQLTLDEITEMVRFGFDSKLANATCRAEGIVGRPLEPLYDRRGNRLILKLKTKDF